MLLDNWGVVVWLVFIFHNFVLGSRVPVTSDLLARLGMVWMSIACKM